MTPEENAARTHSACCADPMVHVQVELLRKCQPEVYDTLTQATVLIAGGRLAYALHVLDLARAQIEAMIKTANSFG